MIVASLAVGTSLQFLTFTNALRTGAGISEFAPLTFFQMISLNSMSGARSSLVKSNSAERLLP